MSVITAIIIGGLFLVRPLFRAVAGTKLRELFTAAALLLVIGIALLMSKVGLSPALGTFLAGVVLANSEYRHELEGDIEPFKGLLLGLFFIAVGASIDFGMISSRPGLIGILVGGLILIKVVIVRSPIRNLHGTCSAISWNRRIIIPGLWRSERKVDSYALTLFFLKCLNPNVVTPSPTSKLMCELSGFNHKLTG